MTAGDPRGIGPEIVAAALSRPGLDEAADFVCLGPDEIVGALPGEPVGVGPWDPSGPDPERDAGRLAGRAVEAAVELAREGRIDGIVTAPLSKAALRRAGWEVPGHTELLRDRLGAGEVTMMMAAETTPLGGPLRLALLTGHLPLRAVPDALTPELVVTRGRIAVRALRSWWGIERPRLAFAGLNPHASEGGLFGDEEERILAPAIERIVEEEDVEVDGIRPADTVFRRCLEGDVDLVVVPYHDVGLAVLKTIALETGVNVTAGLPLPRTSPDHGTALDIAGSGRADPTSMCEAVDLCVRFARRAAAQGRAAAPPANPRVR